MPRLATPKRRSLPPRFAQGFITTMNLPPMLDELLDWCGDDPWSCGTPVDDALDFDGADAFTWTAPPGVGAGDVAFFHYAARARPRVVTLRREVALAGLLDDGLAAFLDRAEEHAACYAGRVFACGILAGPAQPEVGEAADGDRHWRSRLYAPFASVHELAVPLALREHEDVLPRPHKTITELSAAAFAALKARLTAAGNTLPVAIETAEPGRDDFAGISAATWRAVACRPGQRFAHETDVRGYLADYLLEDLKDPGTVVYREARCVGGRAGRRQRRGVPVADYVVRLHGRWIPVEAKRSLWSWPDLLEQVASYVEAEAYDVRAPGGARARVPGHGGGTCLVIDHDGVYLVRDGSYCQSAPGEPLWSREQLAQLTAAALRRRLGCLLR